jgi:hypothetical protein
MFALSSLSNAMHFLCHMPLRRPLNSLQFGSQVDVRRLLLGRVRPVNRQTEDH